MGNKKSRIVTLRTSADFLRLRNEGHFSVVTSWLAISFLPNQTQQLRIGISISRKLGSAVFRNRCRRRLKEILRSTEQLKDLAIDVHFIFRPQGAQELKKADFEDFQKALEKGLQKISKVRPAGHETSR